MSTAHKYVRRTFALVLSIIVGVFALSSTGEKNENHSIFSIAHADIPSGAGGGSCEIGPTCSGASNSNGDPGSGTDGQSSGTGDSGGSGGDGGDGCDGCCF